MVNINIQNYISLPESSSVALVVASYVLDTLACMLIFYLNKHEVETLIKFGIRDYFNDAWNYVDIGLVLTFAMELIVNYLVVIPGF